MKQPKVVIVGGGVVGTSVAYRLAKNGVTDITLLEKDFLGFGASSRSAGTYQTQYLTREDIAWKAIGRPLIEELIKDGSLEFTRVGYLRLASTPDHLEQFEKSVKIQKEEWGLTAMVLSPKEINSKWPDLNTSDIQGGLHGPNDGYVDPHDLCNLLGRAASSKGARILQNHKVIGVQTTGDKVTSVTTDKGEFPCDWIVNCTGAWAPTMGKMLGIDVPIRAYKRQIIALKPTPWQGPFVNEYVPGIEKPSLYFRPETGNLLLVSQHWEGICDWEVAEDPDKYSEKVDWNFVEDISHLLENRLPAAGKAGFLRGWAGLYSFTPDEQPILGVTKQIPNLINALGCHGVGVMISPTMAVVVTELILKGETDLLDLRKYALERFSS